MDSPQPNPPNPDAIDPPQPANLKLASTGASIAVLSSTISDATVATGLRNTSLPASSFAIGCIPNVCGETQIAGAKRKSKAVDKSENTKAPRKKRAKKDTKESTTTTPQPEKKAKAARKPRAKKLTKEATTSTPRTLQEKIPAIIKCRRLRVFSSLPYQLPLHFPANPTLPVSETNSYSHHPSPNCSMYEYNVTLNRLGQCRSRVQDARKLFDEMPHRDAFSYATMISIYLRSNDLPSAEELFLSTPVCARGVAAATAMIDGYAKAGRIKDARGVFDEMPDRNVYSWTCMMCGYFANGQVEEGVRLFDQMPVKNVVSWTSLVQGYARNGMIDEARAEFDRMPERNTVSWTVMMEGYIGVGQIDEALKLFQRLQHPNNYTWNVILSGLLANERVDDAIQLFNSMPNRSLISWTVMITGLAENQLINLAREYFDHMPKKDTPAWNAMITAYAHEGLMAEAEELFNMIPEKNVVSWNAVIEGYAQLGSRHEAYKHYSLMLNSCCLRPNCNTMLSLVISCQGNLDVAASHSLIVKLGFVTYTVLVNALVSAYSRAGDINSARIVFETLENKDIVSWRAMMFAFSNHGYIKHTLHTFSKMVLSGSKPDEAILVSLLSACCHTGLVDKSRKIFGSMRTLFGVEPQKEHYTCLVDTLAKSGRLEEAIEIIREIPDNNLDGIVISALLSSCTLREDLEATRIISNLLIDHIDPDDSAGYMLQANTLAACEKWDEFAEVRKKMKTREIKKIPGVSQIDIRGQTSVFFSGDKSWTELEKVHRCLKYDLQPSPALLEGVLV